MIPAELAYQAEATTGEGSIWHPERHTLFWVDIEGQTLYEYHPDTKECSSWKFDRMVSTVVPETDSTVIIALQDEIVRVNLHDGHTTSVAPIPDENGKVRCNDGKCDPAGHLWVGTMGFGAPKGAGTLYTVSPAGTVTTKLKKVTISNGIVWSSNKKFMYYNDTPTGKIARYRYDADNGDILFDGIAVTLPGGTGVPDGIVQHRQGVHHRRRCVRRVGCLRQCAGADGPDDGGHEGGHRHRHARHCPRQQHRGQDGPEHYDQDRGRGIRS